MSEKIHLRQDQIDLRHEKGDLRQDKIELRHGKVNLRQEKIDLRQRGNGRKFMHVGRKCRKFLHVGRKCEGNERKWKEIYACRKEIEENSECRAEM